MAVIARGPRGNPARRLATHPHAVVVESGVYRIGGLLHAPLGADLEQRWQDGSPMVPLTEAWLEYRSGDQHRREHSEAVIVNRDLATRIELTPELDSTTTGLLNGA